MITGFAVLLLGFFLGMRHATDPDHVIAVSTIVSRERSLSKAAYQSDELLRETGRLVASRIGKRTPNLAGRTS